MADKRIQDLTPASSVQTSDRFVLEQSGQAKSLTGQILINDLAAFLDGHGGINDISYTPPSSGSLTGTLTVTLADETVETFSVTNGRGITSFTKTGTSGLEDTYTITYNDGSTPTIFTVTNGRGIESIGYVESVGLDDYYQIDYNDGSDPTSFIVHNGEKGDTGDNWYVHIRWAAVMPTQDSDIVNYPSDFIGIYAGISATAPTSFTEYQWYDYKGEKGDTGTSITGVSWVSSSGLVDTYRVSFSDGNSTTFNVTNGSQIDSITKTSSSGLVDTYTVLLTNGNQTSFQVNNGKSIVSITWAGTTSPTNVPHVPGATDTYTIAYNDGDTSTFQIYNGLDGEGASITVDGIPSVNGNVPLMTIDTEHGAPTPQTVGSPKSRYFDAINSILYICIGYDENVGYLWRGAGVTVDSALSTSSTNPVQNRVITNKIGTAALDTTAQDLSGAVNEILDDISGFADNLADEYDPTATYAVGDLCIYNNVLYRCNTAISTPEAWNSIHWTATSVDEELDGKVSKSGDIMTGSLYNTASIGIKNPDYDHSDLPSAASSRYLLFKDKSNNNVGWVSGMIEPTGDNRVSIFSENIVNGNTVYNGLDIITYANGTRGVAVTDPAIWRSALNAVNKAGDTMTGVLNMSNTNIKVINTSYDSSDTPSSSSYKYIYFDDKSGNHVGYFGSNISSGNESGLVLSGGRIVNGSQVENSFGLYVKSDGSREVYIPSALKPYWRSALELGTSGAFPITIAQGGSGQTATTHVTSSSSIITVGANCSISSTSYWFWGKMAHLNIAIKANANLASGAIVASLVTGKRPVDYVWLTDNIGTFYIIPYSAGTNPGAITINHALSANQIVYIRAVYLLP